MHIGSTLLTLLVVLIHPAICLSSYRIQLDNGNAVITPAYRQTETSVECYIPGGIVSLPNSIVASIEETDQPYIDGVTMRYGKPEPENKAVRMPKQAGDIKTQPDAIEPAVAKTVENRAFTMGYYVQRNRQLKERLNVALKLVRECSRSQDAEGKKAAQMAARKISRSIYALTDELRGRDSGVLPKDWWDDSDEE